MRRRPTGASALGGTSRGSEPTDSHPKPSAAFGMGAKKAVVGCVVICAVCAALLASHSVGASAPNSRPPTTTPLTTGRQHASHSPRGQQRAVPVVVEEQIMLVADAPVDVVKVFSSGEAQVTRTFELRAPSAGVTRVTLWNITRHMVPYSARVTGRGAGSVVQLSEAPSQGEQDAEQGAVEEALRADVRVKEEAVSAVAEQLQWVRDSTSAQGRVAVSLTDLQNLDAWRESRARDLSSKLITAETELKAARGRLERAVSRRRFSSQNRQVVVDVMTGTAGKLKMELTYRVHGAFWSAAYDLHCTPASTDTPAQLHYYAQVTQRTGEDWDDAAFVLSTSTPGRFVSVPHMDRHVVSLQGFWATKGAKPPPVSLSPSRHARAAGGRMLPKMAMARMATAEMAMDEAADEEEIGIEEEMDGAAALFAGPQAMGVDAGATSVQYSLSERTTIKSGSESHRVTIANIELHATYIHAAAVRNDAQAVVLLEAKNPSEYTLLPGSVTAIVDGDLGGNTQMTLTAPQEEMEVAVGVDNAVRVKIVNTPKVDAKKGQKSWNPWSDHGDRRRQSVTHIFEIVNAKSVPVKIRVHDVLPTVDSEEVKVELKSATRECKLPACQIEFWHDEFTGKLKWDVVLPANGKQQLKVAFDIEWPKDRQLYGIESLHGAA